ncbi:putative nuclease HARBI1 [Zeugodacus cucurbitae]|uniref:putative nuclease HARBI1 n=1 Tax=Zeugodacus cucurbitae TaxID=28588 RepID=UPI0023D92187|nr:putative nuclease HARBI1 [Zeugodacus cucurbitae]
MELSSAFFKENFRLSKDAFMYVLDNINEKCPYQLSSSISPMLKLCCTLRFLAHGSYQQTVGNDFILGFAQPTVSLILNEMLPILETTLCSVWIKTDISEEHKQLTRRKFYTNSGIPNVVGCVDGTHVAIIAPSVNKHLYLNRKGFFSINAMIACNHDMVIRCVDARYGGSSHDSFVWNNSTLKTYLERTYQRGDHNSVYLADSGYPLHEYLWTPYRNALSGTVESKFNKKHAKARNVVERTIGVLKCRFRCILGERKLRYSPSKATMIVNVCCALHNICKQYDVNDPEQETFVDVVVPLEPVEENFSGSAADRRRRQIANSL